MKKKPKFKWFGNYKIYSDGTIEGPGQDRRTRKNLKATLWGLYRSVRISGRTYYVHDLVRKCGNESVN